MSLEQAIITLVAAVISGVLATIKTIFINKYQELIRQKQDWLTIYLDSNIN